MFTFCQIFLLSLTQSGNSGIMLDLAASEKDVHVDFYNGKHSTVGSLAGKSLILLSQFVDFDDLFDEDDL